MLWLVIYFRSASFVFSTLATSFLANVQCPSVNEAGFRANAAGAGPAPSDQQDQPGSASPGQTIRPSETTYFAANVYFQATTARLGQRS